MDKPGWIDVVLAILAGWVLWLPFLVTGLLSGALAALIVVAIGGGLSLPVLASFNRIFAHSSAKRAWSKLAVVAGFCVLAVMMWMVILGGLAVSGLKTPV